TGGRQLADSTPLGGWRMPDDEERREGVRQRARPSAARDGLANASDDAGQRAEDVLCRDAQHPVAGCAQRALPTRIATLSLAVPAAVHLHDQRVTARVEVCNVALQYHLPTKHCALPP